MVLVIQFLRSDVAVDSHWLLPLRWWKPPLYDGITILFGGAGPMTELPYYSIERPLSRTH